MPHPPPRRAQSSAHSLEAETEVPEWGGRDHGVGMERGRSDSGPLAGDGERRDLESGVGNELRKDPVQHVYIRGEEKRRARKKSILLQVPRSASLNWD